MFIGRGTPTSFLEGVHSLCAFGCHDSSLQFCSLGQQIRHIPWQAPHRCLPWCRSTIRFSCTSTSTSHLTVCPYPRRHSASELNPQGCILCQCSNQQAGFDPSVFAQGMRAPAIGSWNRRIISRCPSPMTSCVMIASWTRISPQQPWFVPEWLVSSWCQRCGKSCFIWKGWLAMVGWKYGGKNRMPSLFFWKCQVWLHSLLGKMLERGQQLADGRGEEVALPLGRGISTQGTAAQGETGFTGFLPCFVVHVTFLEIVAALQSYNGCLEFGASWLGLSQSPRRKKGDFDLCEQTGGYFDSQNPSVIHAHLAGVMLVFSPANGETTLVHFSTCTLVILGTLLNCAVPALLAWIGVLH